MPKKERNLQQLNAPIGGFCTNVLGNRHFCLDTFSGNCDQRDRIHF